MGYLLLEFSADRPAGVADSNERKRSIRVAAAPRLKWLSGFNRRDGRTNFTDASSAFTIIHDTFLEYEMRIEAVSPNRPAEDDSDAGAGGYVGDTFSRLTKLASVINQGVPFRLTVDNEESSDAAPPATPRRRSETVLRILHRVGDTAVEHLDRIWGGIIDNEAIDGFAAGDVVFIEDALDRTRFEFNRVASVTDSKNLVLSDGLQFNYESGSIIRHAFYFPKCIGTSVQYTRRKGRKSPAAEAWDFTISFVSVRSSSFAQIVKA